MYPQVIRQFVSQLECSLAGGWVSEQQDAVWRDGKRCLEGGKGKVFLWRRILESHNITFEFCLWKHRGPWFTQAEPWLLLVPNKSSLKSNSQLNPRPVKRQGDLCVFFFFVCLWILHNRQGNGREKDCNDVYWTVSCNTEARQDCKNDISLYPSGITFGI